MSLISGAGAVSKELLDLLVPSFFETLNFWSSGSFQRDSSFGSALEKETAFSTPKRLFGLASFIR